MTDLYEEWLQAKHQEDVARDRRLEAEAAIVEAHGCKDEGSQTYKPDGYKVTITGKINRTLDPASWDSVAGKIPPHLSPVKYKPTLDTRGLKYLQQNEPDLYRIVAEAITAKPGKPAIKVEKA